MSPMASLMTTNRMQQCLNVLTDIYSVFLLLFHGYILLEIKFTTTNDVYLLVPARPMDVRTTSRDFTSSCIVSHYMYSRLTTTPHAHQVPDVSQELADQTPIHPTITMENSIGRLSHALMMTDIFITAH